MNHERAEMMQKALAKRRRREESNSARKASLSKAPSTNAAGSIVRKVIVLAQDAAVQVGTFVKTAADKITGAGEETTGGEIRCSP
jgi:hypothetical protein